MTTKNSHKKIEQASSAKAGALAVHDQNPSLEPSGVKFSYTQTILAKRKAALDQAQKAFEQAIKKRELELGKLCLECGLGDYDNAFLKEQFLKLLGSFPKRSNQA